jgi:hypothetical protein
VTAATDCFDFFSALSRAREVLELWTRAVVRQNERLRDGHQTAPRGEGGQIRAQKVLYEWLLGQRTDALLLVLATRSCLLSTPPMRFYTTRQEELSIPVDQDW